MVTKSNNSQQIKKVYVAKNAADKHWSQGEAATKKQMKRTSAPIIAKRSSGGREIQTPP